MGAGGLARETRLSQMSVNGDLQKFTTVYLNFTFAKAHTQLLSEVDCYETLEREGVLRPGRPSS